jgi:protein transport protein SEC13
MATPLTVVDTKHMDMIHDSQFDYYAKKMATCSSDRTIKIFDVAGEVYHNCATLVTHEGPVWQVAWAHPKFGIILASCSYDGSVAIHRESPKNSWSVIHEHKFHDSSVNSIEWAPHEYGLCLACASSDGRVSVLEHRDGNWLVTHFNNDTLGCNAVSWAPYSAYDSLTENDQLVRRLVTGSCDNLVRVWRQNDSGGKWEEESVFQSSIHTDWVRDVAWAPNSAMPFNVLATCSEDRTVYIWTQMKDGGKWTPCLMKAFDAPVWRVSWSVTGNVLAVSTADHQVTLWKQSVDESWIQISSMLDEGSK